MKNESRCPLDVNECGNVRDSSRDCDFVPCDDEEDGGGLFCTDDVFECTDGTFVPRNPDNNCEFEPCPIVDVGDPIVLCGLLIGAMLPFLFAALTMLSVRKVSIE